MPAITSDTLSSLTGGAAGATSPAATKPNAAANMDFLQLIVTQMKNQNPLDPTSSDQMVQSMSMMQIVNETHQMNTKMTGWAQSQGLLLGANIIGGQATVRDSAGAEVKGVVNAVSVNNGEVQVQVGKDFYPLSSIIHVQQ